MNIITTVFITLGALLLIGMLYYAILYKRPGIYPPKKLLRSRAASLGSLGGLLFTAGLLMAIFSK